MQKVKLGEICKVLNGYAFSSDKYVESGLRIIRIINVQKGYIEDDLPCYYPIEKERELQKFILKENDLLISLTGNVGRVGLLPKKYLPSVLNQRVGCIRVNDENKVNNKYLFHFLNNDKFEVESVYNAKGVAQKNMSTEWLKQQEIPLPPLEEQRAIAEKLDKVSQLVDKRKEQLQQLDQLVKSQFISFFGSTDLSDEKKSNVRIGDVAEIVGGSTPKTDIEEYWNGEYFWITPAELKDDSYMIKTTIRKLTKAGVESCSLKKMPVNTVLLSSRAPIGKVAITGVEMYCNQGFKNIICSNKLQPTFIYFLLKYNTKYLNSLGRGATFKEISKSIVENIKIPLPPMEPQNQFAEFVEKVEKLKEKVNNSLTHLNLLKQSLMQQYFG